MLVCALAVSIITARGQSAILDTKVTFSTPGIATPQLIEELSKAAHVSLFAPPAFRSDIIAVRVKDAPLGVLLAKIGNMTAGDWQRKGDGFELVRSTAKLHAEEAAEQSREIAKIQEAIDKQKKALAGLERWDDASARALAIEFSNQEKQQTGSTGQFDRRAWERLQVIDSKGPGGRTMTRVMAALQAKDVAAQPLDYKIVYSDQPTQLQRPLPPAVIPALRDLVAEQNMWSDVVGQLLPDQSNGMYASSLYMKKGFEGKVGKVLLMITKSKNGGNLNMNVDLEAANQKGVVVVRSSQNINTFGDYSKLNELKPVPGEQPVQPSPLDEAMRSIFTAQGAPTSKVLPKEIVDVLIHPEQSEPLGLSAGDLFMKVAEAKDLNMVVDLPDDSFMLGAFAAFQKMTPSMVLQTLGITDLQVDQADGWLTLTPKSPFSTRSQRADRKMLGDFVRAVASKGHASLDDLAHYATTVQDELYNTIGYQLAMLVSPMRDTQYYNRNMLKLYGLLDSAQRQQLAKGNGMLLSSLSDQEKEVVNKMIFGENSNLQLNQRPSRSAEDFEAFYNGIFKEPTELFGKGVPPGATLKLNDISDRVAISAPTAGPNGGMIGSQPMGPMEVAQAIYAQERPGLFPWIEQQGPFEQRKFTFGGRRRLDFTFDFGQLAQMSEQLQDVDYNSTEPVEYARLPDDFKKQVEVELVQMRKQYANVKPGQLGGPPIQNGPPPPHP